MILFYNGTPSMINFMYWDGKLLVKKSAIGLPEVRHAIAEFLR